VKFVLLSVLLILTGCGGITVGIRSFVASWTSNGNPLVPQCGSTLKNCWSGYTVLDQNNELTMNLEPSALSFTAPNATDTYEIRVNGYDLNGQAIYSKYEVIPVQ
jgi:hypothetical protein